MWRTLGVLGAAIVVLTGGALVFREALVNLWLKKRLVTTLADFLGADIRLDEVDWRDGVLRAGKLRISGGELPFASCDAKGVNVPIDWNDLFEPTSLALSAEVAVLDLLWHTPNAKAAQRVHAIPPLAVSVARLSFRHAENLSWSLRDLPLTASHKDGVWTFAGRGGTVVIPEAPLLQLERATAKHAGETFQIEDFSVRGPQGGTINGQAWHTVGGSWAGRFQWQNIDLAGLPGWRWDDHLSGQTVGSATLENGILRGQMFIRSAKTQAVPQLMKLAGLFTGENWTAVPWETLRFDFVRDAQGRVEFTNLEAISSKGLAVRGAGHYATESLGADLEIGVALAGRPWLNALMPILFRSSNQGYLWTPVKVGGTPSAPTEDLTTRVVAALAIAPVEGAVETASDLPGTAVEAASGLLRGFFGN